MVRLKVAKEEALNAELQNFNSSMVRLKGKLHSVTLTGETVFQFQYGSIKSRRLDDKKILIIN